MVMTDTYRYFTADVIGARGDRAREEQGIGG
jgi:hypothetical protein